VLIVFTENEPENLMPRWGLASYGLVGHGSFREQKGLAALETLPRKSPQTVVPLDQFYAEQGGNSRRTLTPSSASISMKSMPSP
jgi:hypothetical protein